MIFHRWGGRGAGSLCSPQICVASAAAGETWGDRESIKFASGGGAFVGCGRAAAVWRQQGGRSCDSKLLAALAASRWNCLATLASLAFFTFSLLALMWMSSRCLSSSSSSSSSSSGGPQLSRQPGLEGKDGWASPPLPSSPASPPPPPTSSPLPHFQVHAVDASPLENLLIDECS